jgi:hypothetical protein
MRSPKLPELVSEQILVGDLAVDYGARLELAVPDVLQRVTPTAAPDLHGLYGPAVYVEADGRRAERDVEPFEYHLSTSNEPQV